MEEFEADFQRVQADRRFHAKVAEYHHVQDDSANNKHTIYGAAFNVMVKVITERVWLTKVLLDLLKLRFKDGDLRHGQYMADRRRVRKIVLIFDLNHPNIDNYKVVTLL